MKINVRGIRRTGNNFLICLLKNNIDALKLGGCAHILPPKRDYDKNIIIIIKNPYSWFLSITKWAKISWHRHWDWQKNWEPYKKQYENFNKFYEKYMYFVENCYGHAYTIKYEDLLKDPYSVIKQICADLDVLDNLKPEDLFKVPKQVPQSGNFNNKRKSFYLSGGTYGLDKELIEKINNVVSWEVMYYYGYDKINL